MPRLTFTTVLSAKWYPTDPIIQQTCRANSRWNERWLPYTEFAAELMKNSGELHCDVSTHPFKAEIFNIASQCPSILSFSFAVLNPKTAQPIYYHREQLGITDDPKEAKVDYQAFTFSDNPLETAPFRKVVPGMLRPHAKYQSCVVLPDPSLDQINPIGIRNIYDIAHCTDALPFPLNEKIHHILQHFLRDVDIARIAVTFREGRDHTRAMVFYKSGQ